MLAWPSLIVALSIAADFHGWRAVVLRNPSAEVVVVPALGRVMQFRLRGGKAGAGRAAGPFWNHPALDRRLAPDAEGWLNAGGDKAWPAPQSDWPTVTGSGWPPPRAFDALPQTASVAADGLRVELLSPVDPGYGVRVRRTIALDPRRPVMTIETRYEKVRGPPVRIAVWTITQLAAPERAFILLPQTSAFPGGHRSLLPAPPRDLKVDGRLLSLARDAQDKTMIGSDGDALLWVGQGPDLLIENLTAVTDRGGGASAAWPNDGLHAQVYTSSGDEMGYVELELLDRLRELGPGQSATGQRRYTLIPRTRPDPLAEAQAVFAARAR